jgi:hypothetical protein
MDVGTIAIYLSGGTPLVARCDEAAGGLTFVPALNADALVEAAHRVLELEGVDLTADGLYLCPDELSAEALFPPITLPGDLVSFATARALLYPEVASKNTGLQRVRRDVQAGRLRAYRVGLGHELRQFASRAQVLQLAAQQAVAAP